MQSGFTLFRNRNEEGLFGLGIRKVVVLMLGPFFIDGVRIS